MEAASKRITYEAIQQSRLFETPVQGERSQEYREIREAMNVHVSKIREAYWAKACSELLDFLPAQFEKFLSRYYDRSQEFMAVPIFKYYPAQRLPGRILGLRTEELFKFAQIMDKRYVDLNFAPDLRDDYDSINLLLARINKLLAGKKRKTLRGHWLTQLASVLKKVSDRLKPTGVSVSDA
jgi:hypothetical protein